MEDFREYWKPQKQRTRFIIIGVASLLFGFLFGFLAGYYGRGDCICDTPTSSSEEMLKMLTREADESISSRLMEEMKASNIGNYLKNMTSRSHLAGTPADYYYADLLRNFWIESGLQGYVIPYNVLLSYPPMDNKTFNVIRKVDISTNETVFSSTPNEEVLWEDDNKPDTIPPFNSYAPPGHVAGEPVYVNYARENDFQYLHDNHPDINLQGKICIARYGAIFRGDKAKLAQQNGCIGLVLYSDPINYAPNNVDSYYPDTWWLPPTGVQRGTIKTPGTAYGDPLTPGYASIESAFRIAQEEAEEIPTILVQPIGYGDAEHFLSGMTGADAPLEWRGGLNISYKLGPGYINPNLSLDMELFNTFENRTIYNAFGVIPGHIEPDRYVLLGNHRDSWVVGAVDPHSGTAAMMEISRAMSEMVKQGWQPRRTIIFCSWGGEEHGLIGSTEWAEEYRKLLSERAVAYINFDTVVSGNLTMDGGGVPLVYDYLYNASKVVPNPNAAEAAAGRTYVYDSWLYYTPEKINNVETGRPQINNLGAGSDQAALIGKIGIPCFDIGFSMNYSYPTYHSAYDSYKFSLIVDQDFVVHRAVAQVGGEVLRSIADTYVLPFDTHEYSQALQRYVKDVESVYGNLIRAYLGQSGLDHLNEATAYFEKESNSFIARRDSVDKQNPISVRALNDQIMQLERVFIDPFGLPNREDIRHLVYAPSTFDSYSGINFPGIADTIYTAQRSNSTEDWNAVAQQMAALTYSIHAAGNFLHDAINFLSPSSVSQKLPN